MSTAAPESRALVAGWFSFADGEATAGDLVAAQTVSRWLARRCVPHDVAYAPVFADALTLDEVQAEDYETLIFVCGPLAGRPVQQLVRRFRHCHRVAVGVSVLDKSLAREFHSVLARDGDGTAAPDLTLFPGAMVRYRPLAAVVLANPQPEYGRRSRHDEVHAAIADYLAEAPLAVVDADTRVDPRVARQSSAAQVQGVLRAVDVVLSTRLHGLALGLRLGTPVVAIDPIDGGAKVAAQAGILGWPAILLPADVSTATLDRWVTFCLGGEATAAVHCSQERGANGLAALEERLSQVVGATAALPRWRPSR